MAQPDPLKKMNPQWYPIIDAYCGDNWQELADLSGYTIRYLKQIFKRPEVILAVQLRHKKDTELRPHIAHRKERQRFWTEVMRNQDENIYARMRASELLGKSEGDFVNRAEKEDPELGKIPPHVRRALAEQYKRTTEQIPDGKLRELEKGDDGVYRVRKSA